MYKLMQRQDSILDSDIDDIRAITVHDVARQAGVSIATVSRVLSGKSDVVAKATAGLVRDAARDLGYTPSEIGRSLRRSSSRIVVMIVPDSTNDFCADVSVSVERALVEHDLSMVLMNSGEDPARQESLLADAESLRPRAVVLLGALDTPALRAMAGGSRDIIFVNRRPPGHIIAPYVGIDNIAAGRAVADHFVAQGFRRVAVVHGPLQYSASRGRVDGFIGRMGELGVGNEDIHRIEGPLTMEAGYAHGRTLCADASRPEAVFCGNDMIAYGIHRAATEAGLNIPGDLAICGFDDNRVNEWLAPWLTSVRVPALEIGPAVRDLIISRAPQTVRMDHVLPFTLVERASTRRCAI